MAGTRGRPPRATGDAQPGEAAAGGPRHESYGPLVLTRPGKDDGRALILYEAATRGQG
jgi:hypothetical protein